MIKAIAIDLDDTLVDTSGLLVPAAASTACQAMIEAGLQANIEDCLKWRAALAPNHSHKEIFRLIAEKAGAADPVTLGDVGSKLFYNPPIPSPLPLLAGADDVLNALTGRARLFLVTSGAPETQWKKIRAARLEPRFEGLFVVDKFKSESKETAFRKILEITKAQPSEFLSVGNRLREEIRHAKKLGGRTCYFEYGEHLGETPEGDHDIPDHRVRGWAEFLSECRL